MTAAHHQDEVAARNGGGPGGGGRILPAGTVDCHAHVLKKDAPLAPLRHSAPARDASVDEYLSLLDRHHVTYGLLTAPSFYGSDNTLLLESLRSAQGRLRGTAIVEPDIRPNALQALRREGVCGIRLNWIKRPSIPDASGADYQRLFSCVHDLGMHVEVYLEGERLPPVLEAIQRSGATAVIDHFGSPDPVAGVEGGGFRRLLDAIQQGRVWVKLSAPYRLGGVDVQVYVDRFFREGAAERMVWATDWPWVGFEDAVTYEQCVDWLFDWVSDERLRHTILVDSPKKLFGFEDGVAFAP
ncbi:amidohydrolase family protein [Parapusillimonas sp. SGNA-6]|nr:amidohydrolase family protein [Parapusillimonas sp. SGNA-6]